MGGKRQGQLVAKLTVLGTKSEALNFFWALLATFVRRTTTQTL